MKVWAASVSVLYGLLVFACTEKSSEECATGVADSATAPTVSNLDQDARPSPVDALPPLKAFRVMTYNIKHGAVAGLDAVAALINQEEPDVVALQEVDVGIARSGSIDQPHRLGQLTGRGNLFRTAALFQGGNYGVALLSRYPILSSTSTPLTSSPSESRILATVDVVLPGRTITIGVTHLDLSASVRDTQIKEIRPVLSGKPFALLFGDMNAEPTEASMGALREYMRDAWTEIGIGDGFTIPPAGPTRRIDYVYLAPDWGKPIEAHVPSAKASDHLPVVVTLPLP